MGVGILRFNRNTMTAVTDSRMGGFLHQLRVLISEVWSTLPAWFVFFITAHTLLGYLSFLREPKPSWAFTILFPYSMFLLYCFARSKKREQDTIARRRFFVVSLITSLVLIGLAAAGRPIRIGSGWHSHFDTFVSFYEFSNVCWTMLLAAHCAAFRGLKDVPIFFGAAMIYGMILESGGVTMGFFREDYYHWYLPGLSAPIATMLGWSTILYTCIVILDGIREALPGYRLRSPFILALSLAIIGLCLDAAIDPFATDFGLWVWNPLYEPATSPFFCGVPLVNFVSWFSALFSFGVCYYTLEARRPAWAGLRKAGTILVALPAVLMLAAMIEFLSLALIEGTQGPSWTILRQYVAQGMPLHREPVRGPGK